MDRLICILGALREEINLIRGQMTVDEQFKFGKADAWAGKWEGTRIVLVRTGVGQNFALKALEKVLNQVNPSLILSIGYAGGLDPKLKVGDVVFSDHVLRVDRALNDVGSYRIEIKKADFFEKLTCPEKIVVHKGKLITADQVIGDPAVKKKLGSRYNALAVDMETAALVAHAVEKNITIFPIRAISDTAEQSLVDVSSFISGDGEVSKLQTGWYAVTHPYTIKNFISLHRQSQLATLNLTEFVGFFIRTYLYSGSEFFENRGGF